MALVCYSEETLVVDSLEANVVVITEYQVRAGVFGEMMGDRAREWGVCVNKYSYQSGQTDVWNPPDKTDEEHRDQQQAQE